MAALTCHAGMHFPLGHFYYWLRDPRTGKSLQIDGEWMERLPRDLRHRIEAAEGRAIELAPIDLVIICDIHARMLHDRSLGFYERFIGIDFSKIGKRVAQ